MTAIVDRPALGGNVFNTGTAPDRLTHTRVHRQASATT